MRKRPINIIGGFYKDPNLHWSRQDTLNWIPVAAEREGTLSPFQLRDAPGVKPFVRISRTVGEAVIDVGPIRGMRNVEGKLFVVAAQTCYQISNTGVAIPVGTIPGVGRVSMAHNQFGLSNQLLIVNGSAGYVVDTNLLTVEKVTDEGYPGAFIVDFMDQYLVQVEPQGRYWFHSDLADALAYNTLDRYEAESDPDRIVSLIRSNTDLFLFGKESTDIFVNTGQQTGTFAPAPNTGLTVGCSAKFTPRRMANSIYWLDDKRIVRRLDGYTDQRISTEAIDSAFSECSELEIAQAYGFTWETQGHKVYYITVPGRFTFGYDVLTQQWHRRSTWELPHWDVVDAVFWNGKWIVGSGQNGRLYELDQLYKLDRCDPLVRKRVTGKLWDAENEMTLNNVELKFNTGGPVSVCVPFPVQPEGPILSGDAPAGTVGTPYTFSYTATPGDSPIVRTVLMPGSTDLTAFGLSWNQATATLSGTPTKTGMVTLNLRVYDTAGLFANHTDEIQIAVLMMATRETGGGVNGYYLRIDGNWSDTWQTNANISGRTGYQLEVGDRILSYAISGSVYRTEDYGTTSALSTGSTMGGSGGARLGWSYNNIVLIPGGVNEIRKSTDGGDTFTTVSGSPNVNAIGRNPVTGRWIAFAGDNKLWYSEDDGDTWTEGLTASDATASIYMGRCVHPDGRVFFSCSNGAGTQVKVFSTVDAEEISNQTLPAFVDGSVYGTAMHVFNETVIVGTEDGEVAYNDGSGWELSAGSMQCFIAQIADNGVEVLMIGGDHSLDTDGYIKSTMDLEDFTTRLTSTLSGTERWVGITG